MNTKNKRIIVVIGMHRSGTSAITRGLPIFGATLGDNLMMPFSDNPTGFWEDKQITELNEEILKIIGSAWHDTKSICISKLYDQKLKPQKEKALTLISDRIAKDNLFAWKDPRASILLMFWQDVFKQLDLDDSYIISLRNPVSVIESLFKRNGFKKEKSFLLWSKYTLNAIKLSEGKLRILVDYDNLLKSPVFQLERIANALKLPSPYERQELLQEYIYNFISTDLRHSLFDHFALESCPQALSFTKTLYKWLSKIADDEIDFRDPLLINELKNIENNFYELESLYSYIDQIELENENIQNKLMEIEKKYDLCNSQWSKKVNDIQTELIEKITQFEKVRAQSTQKDTQIDELRAQSTQKDTQIDELRAQSTQKDTQIDELRAQSAQNNEAIRCLNTEIEVVYQSKSWKLTKPLRASMRVIRYLYKCLKYIMQHSLVVVIHRSLTEIYNMPIAYRLLPIIPIILKQRLKSFVVMNDPLKPTISINTTNPKLSIIIPVYNHAEYLDQCIQSALAQDYENVEVVVVDDASSDCSVRSILKKYKNDKRIKQLFNEKNLGISETQNRALHESDGDIIAFLDCDDFLSTNAVSSSLQYWRKNTKYLHTARININKNGKEFQRISFEHLPRKDYFSENLERMYATHFKMMRRDVFSHVGLFDPRFDSAQDYDMLMRIAFHYPSEDFVFAPEFVYFHRYHDKQETIKKGRDQDTFTKKIQYEARMRKEISSGNFYKEINIIMLSYGKCEQTLEAVQSLAYTVKIPFNLILFDNGSDSFTLNFLESKVISQFPFIKFIPSKENIGIAAGRMKAMKSYSADYYITFDNDEIAQPGWIEELLVRGETDSQIGAVVSRVCYPDDTLQFSGGYIEYIDNELIRLGRYDMGKSRFDLSTAAYRDCDWLPIGATLFKMDISQHLKEDYQNVFEDAAVSFGLKKMGYRLVNSPGSIVQHNHFTYMSDVSMKDKYLKARYDPLGMLAAIARFYADNKLIIYDDYVWKETGLLHLTREEIKRKLRHVFYSHLTTGKTGGLTL